MEDSRKERLILLIATVAGISCILQTFFGGWEFWVVPLILIGIIALWWVHFFERMEFTNRINLYYMFSALLLFYHGVHDTSLFDIAVATMLFMASFTILDRAFYLNMIIIEYIILLIYQFILLYVTDNLHMDAFTIMRLIFQIGSVFALYFFCRITVSGRSAEGERIKKWRKTVENNERDMEDFLSNISHELRTPVNVVNGMTVILQKDNDSDDLAAIREAGIRLQHQIEDIQDYTELKRRELTIEENDYMCTSLINDVVVNYNSYENKKNLELIVDLDPEIPTMLKGDIKKLHKMIRHLLENAMKFTRRGGMYIRVYAIPQEYGVNLEIEVSDTGIGMTRADIARLSGGMFQANKKRNRSTGGIGIGLPIVYGIAHSMNGFVNISSKKGKGTTVRLSIPQQVVDPAPCLCVSEDMRRDIVFYVKWEKYKVPELRDFNRSMAVNLARGLKRRLYYAGSKRELEHLGDDLDIGFIFTGQEEYEAEASMFNYLASQGVRVVVYTNSALKNAPEKGVIVLPKPLYGFPVVRILNGDTDIEGSIELSEAKPRYDGVRALIVDDEPMNLIVATGLLKEYGMIPYTADSGKDAIEKYTAEDYDIVFMDHMMPEMDGVEAMKRIRQIAMESQRHPVIVALTANALSGAREMFLREGFDGFIAKPIDLGEFERVMKRVLPEDNMYFEGRDAS